MTNNKKVDVKDSRKVKENNIGKFQYRKENPIDLPRKEYEEIILYGTCLETFQVLLPEEQFRALLYMSINDHLKTRFTGKKGKDVLDVLKGMPDGAEVYFDITRRSEDTRYYGKHLFCFAKETIENGKPVCFVSKQNYDERERLTPKEVVSL